MNLEEITKILKPGDLILTKKLHRPIVDDLIWSCSISGVPKELQNPKVSHVAIYIGNEEIIEQTWDGTRQSKEEYPILFKDYNVYIIRANKEFNVEKFIIGLQKLITIPFGKCKVLRLIVQRFLRKLGIKIKLKGHNTKTLLCGELTAIALREAGFDPMPGFDPIEIIPLDYYNCGNFHEITRSVIGK